MVADSQVRFFLGANSPAGFYSLYDQMLCPAEAEEIFILKGGPGCGKSSLMRRVAAAVEAGGQAVEYIQCSGDPSSLDAVIFPALKTALVDGTAPHVVEPQYPGLVERYIDLGEGYDHGGLQAVRDEILSCMAGGQSCYARAYRCLAAAAQIEEDLRTLLSTPAAEAKMAKRARGILAREVKKLGGEPGRAVQRFLSAITGQGVVCNYGTADALCGRIYELADTYGLAHGMLTHLATGAMAAGYDVIVCPSPMAPDRIEHLLIPALSLAFVSTTPTLPYTGRPYRRIRLDAIADSDLLRRSRPRLRFGRKVSAALVEEAVESLAQAKSAHDTLEAYYNPYVDFEAVYRRADEITRALLSRAAH